MTFNPLMAQAVYHLVQNEQSCAHVCELGNQRLTVNEDTYALIEMSQRPASTREFYQALGFESYTALDVNERMDARVVDLNAPIRNRHYDLMGKFDLVTNNGTGEHIFDQARVFENVHDLCKIQGVMLHILPFGPWVNHGFYNYNPILFRDLQVANGYQTLFVWLSDRWGNRAEIEPSQFTELFREKKPEALMQTANQVASKAGADVSIVVAWRKIDEGRFRTPFQGKYVADITATSVKARYEVA